MTDSVTLRMIAQLEHLFKKNPHPSVAAMIANLRSGDVQIDGGKLVLGPALPSLPSHIVRGPELPDTVL